jgi:tryptophan-rich sensory protein
MKQIIIVAPFIISNIVQFLTMKPNSYTKDLLLQPPSYVFGIVWSTIYLLFGAYLYNVLETHEPFIYWIMFLWILNFVLNLVWSPVVFIYKKYTIGVYMIVLMISTLIGLMISTVNVVSKNMLIPYISWLILALLLNVELVRRKG